MSRTVSPNMLRELRVSGVFAGRVSLVRWFPAWTACRSGVRPWKGSFMLALAPFEVSGS